MDKIIKEFLTNKTSRNSAALIALLAAISVGDPWLAS